MRKLQDVRSGATGKSLQVADRNVSSWMPVCREFSQGIFHMTEVSVRTLLFDKPYKISRSVQPVRYSCRIRLCSVAVYALCREMHTDSTGKYHWNYIKSGSYLKIMILRIQQIR